MEIAIVVALVALAGAGVAYRLYRNATGRSGCGCSGRRGCGQGHKTCTTNHPDLP